jgi:hypothetical protein
MLFQFRMIEINMCISQVLIYPNRIYMIYFKELAHIIVGIGTTHIGVDATVLNLDGQFIFFS